MIYFYYIKDIMKKCSNKKVILPVSSEIPSTYMLQPMGVLKATEETKDWYYENFINICCDNSQNPRFLNVGNGFMGWYLNVFEYSVSTYEDFPADKIVNRLKSELDKRNYAFIYLDEYYISAKKAYMRYAFRHQSLIYGYDETKQIFNAIAFDKTGHYAELEYSYEEVKKAYVSGEDCQDELIIEPFGVAFFKVMPHFSHEISLKNIINTLYDYINESYPHDYRYTHANIVKRDKTIPQTQLPDVAFGLNVVREMANFIEQRAETNLNFGHFKRVHFLYEHAQIIHERLIYYKKRFSFDDSYDYVISEYSKLVQKYQQARLLFLKVNLSNNLKGNNLENQKKSMLKIAQIIKKIIPIEKAILRKAICFLEKELNRQSSNNFNIEYSKLKPIEDYNLELEKISDRELRAKISLATPRRIKCLSVAKVADYTIKSDGLICDSAYYKNLVSFNENTLLKIGNTASQIIVEAVADFDLKFEDLQLGVYTESIFYGKEITASSMWENDDGSKNQLYSPCNVTHESHNACWRAKKQLNSYCGNDWLEVNMGTPKKLNTIIIIENNRQPRIKKYAISYTDGQAITRDLLIAEFKSGQKQILKFPEITATSVKIKFIECTPDYDGYAEPLIMSFEGYYSY